MSVGVENKVDVIQCDNYWSLKDCSSTILKFECLKNWLGVLKFWRQSYGEMRLQSLYFFQIKMSKLFAKRISLCGTKLSFLEHFQ